MPDSSFTPPTPPIPPIPPIPPTPPPPFSTVLLLAGGPDSEREISLASADTVERGLRDAGRTVHRVDLEDRITQEQLAKMPGHVVWPALHGSWGEGGGLQDLLELDPRPFVGCASLAARHAMDKLATKLTARGLGIPTPEARVYNPADPVCPIALPVVLKPVHEGSTIGLHLCRTSEQWALACGLVQREHWDRATPRVYMVERAIDMRGGQRVREFSSPVLDGEALPIVQIEPKSDHYDFASKYEREDTVYTVDPEIGPELREAMQTGTLELARSIGVRHLCRADWLVDPDGGLWFLEINTMPGFTEHSLLPLSAAHTGLGISGLCARLVEMAVRDG